MSYYDLDPFNTPLNWSDVFTGPEDFESQMIAIEPTGVAGITASASLEELYFVLAMKYYASQLRYQTPEAFIIAIKRELQVEFKYYIEKKSLADELIALTDDEIEVQRTQLRNLVDTHDEPIANADTVAWDDLSTEQENVLQKINKLDAKKRKYNAMKADYVQNIYKKCDGLFRQILSSDNIYLFEEE